MVPWKSRETPKLGEASHATEKVISLVSTEKLRSVPILIQPLYEAISTPAQSANVLKSQQYFSLLTFMRHSLGSQIKRYEETWVPTFASIIVDGDTAYPLRMPQLRQ